MDANSNKTTDNLKLIKRMWEELEDFPFNENKKGELILSEKFYHFPKGTTRKEIWLWFDQYIPITNLIYFKNNLIYSQKGEDN